MRNLPLLFALFCVSLPAVAQESAPAPPSPKQAPQDPHGFFLDDTEIDELMRIPGDDSPAAQRRPDSPRDGGEAKGPVWRIELRDGQRLKGRVVSESRDEIVLEIAPGARVTLARSSIVAVRFDDPNQAPTSSNPAPRPASTGARSDPARAPHSAPSARSAPHQPPSYSPPHHQGPRPMDLEFGRRFVDPNRTRHLYGPSAMMLQQGEGSLSQKELFFTSFNYGVTDWFSVQVGGIVPIWFIDGGFNLIGGVKLGGQVLKYVHLSAGAQSLVMAPAGIFGTVGFGFGNVTFGTPDLHATLTFGVPWMANVEEAAAIGDFIVTASGVYRMTDHVGFVTENWVFPTAFRSADGFTHILSLAVRLMSEHLSADIGFLVIPHVPLPVPWLSGTWNFQL